MSYRYSKLNIKVRTEAYLEGHEIYSFGRMLNGLFLYAVRYYSVSAEEKKNFKTCHALTLYDYFGPALGSKLLSLDI